MDIYGVVAIKIVKGGVKAPDFFHSYLKLPLRNAPQGQIRR